MKFNGLSTKGFYLRGNNFNAQDLELVKENIINHIYTRKGERVNMPNFGTRIPELAFEPMDEDLLNVIREDLKHVVEYEKRVKLIDMMIMPDPDANAVMARLILEYVGTGLQTELAVSIATGS